MSKFPVFRVSSIAPAFMVLWLILSAFYYVDHLFSPSFYFGYDEGVFHKVLKYIVCFSLGFYLCITARAYGLLFFSGLLVLVASFFVINSGSLEIATLSMMITGVMLPFALIPALWTDRLLLIGRVVVLCGAVVGIFSIIELTIISSRFESYWNSTQSIRSISTLFNPNNLGLYVGAALLLLPYMQLKTLTSSLCGALLIFALVVSGSRTAWVALIVVFVYALLVSADARKLFFSMFHKKMPQLILTGVAFAIIYVIYLVFGATPNFEIAHRGTDLYTASVRLGNLQSFIDLVDVGLFLPDTQGVRANFIQDNFYLVVLNSFGILGLFLFLIFFMTYFSFWSKSKPELFPWKLIFVFYMVSGLSGSQLNSFPNNQLFFISIGAVWIYRPIFGRSQARLAHVSAPSS